MVIQGISTRDSPTGVSYQFVPNSGKVSYTFSHSHGSPSRSSSTGSKGTSVSYAGSSGAPSNILFPTVRAQSYTPSKYASNQYDMYGGVSYLSNQERVNLGMNTVPGRGTYYDPSLQVTGSRYSDYMPGGSGYVSEPEPPPSYDPYSYDSLQSQNVMLENARLMQLLGYDVSFEGGYPSYSPHQGVDSQYVPYGAYGYDNYSNLFYGDSSWFSDYYDDFDRELSSYYDYPSDRYASGNYGQRYNRYNKRKSGSYNKNYRYGKRYKYGSYTKRPKRSYGWQNY